MSQNSTKGGPFGSAGGRIPEGGGGGGGEFVRPLPKFATDSDSDPEFFFNGIVLIMIVSIDISSAYSIFFVSFKTQN